MAYAKRIVVSCALAGLVSLPSVAATRVSQINQRSFTILAAESQWLPTVEDIAQQLNHREGLHILPVRGDGCVQASADLLHLQQIDMAIVTADCVAYAEAQGLLPDATRKLAYVARLKSLPIIIVTRRDISNITALAGLRIATGPVQSAGFSTGEVLLGGLGLPFTRVAKSNTEALIALKNGSADAALLVGLDALDGSLDPSKFHAIGVSAPVRADQVYAPALLNSDDLKGLPIAGLTLETVSTALALAIVNWPAGSEQSRKMQVFATQYFDLAADQAASDPVSAMIPNWQRHLTSVQALEALSSTGIETNPAMQKGDGP